MRIFFAVLLAASLGSLSFAELMTTPRRSPEFAILMPGGGQLLLSSYRGKVVLLEFLVTTCSHCQHEAQVVSKLYEEFAPRGFQALGVAFDTTDPAAVANFSRNFQVKFPVGFSPRPPVTDYLNVSATNRLMVPQVVLIDRKGMIRVQTPPEGDARMQDETFLRSQIEELLKEPAGVHHPVAAHKHP
ncbi:MAG TPA: TlpA disulfide reductase family protein [Bryobacteraceae bacterium]|nr:TlpA disulfide reductase family protein [Bryobacteraceae bacterium]